MNSRLSKTLVSLFAVCTLLSPKVFGESPQGSNLPVEAGELLVIAAAQSPESASNISTSTKKSPVSPSAHTTPIVLTLESIEVVKTAEQFSGDEIYVNITEYSSVDKPAMHRVPEYPSHWLSKYMDKVKNVPLWTKNIRDTESVELIISVVESEAPPWDVDDLIGSVKLKVYIEKGKLEQEWSVPNKSIVKEEGAKGHFVLTGDGAEYKISLKLKLDKEIDKTKEKDKAKAKDKTANKK